MDESYYSVQLFRAGTKVLYLGKPYEILTDTAKSNEIGGMERKVQLLPIQLIDGEWEMSDERELTVMSDRTVGIELMGQ